MQIRPSTAADFPAVVAAMATFQAYIASLDPLKRTRSGKDFDAVAYTRICVQQAETEGGLFLLAEDEDRLVGLIVASLAESSEKDALDEFASRDGEVLELYVDEAYRGQKLGFTLVQAAEKHFRDLGCTGLLVDCFAPNTPSHGFYERYGFTDRLITMRKPLP